MLLGTFKVGENVPACGAFIGEHQRFGWVAQPMHGSLMLAQSYLRPLKVASIAVTVVKIAMMNIRVVLGYGDVKLFISS